MGRFFTIALLCALSVPVLATDGATPFLFTVGHTNDLHSHFEGNGPDGYFTPQLDPKSPVEGHYARIAGEIRKIRARKQAAGEPFLMFDVGDPYSGTLFHTLAPLEGYEAPELEFFEDTGYDALTMGNHDIDAGEMAYVRMLQKQPKVLEKLVISNVEVTEDAPRELKEMFARIKPFLIRELTYQGRTLRIGVIGLVGPDAARASYAARHYLSFVGYDDTKGAARMEQLNAKAAELALRLRKDEHVDLVIALFHGGAPEDSALAKAVPDIDLVLSGHTHELYEKPKRVKRTLVNQAGCHGQHMGLLELSADPEGLALRNEQTIITIDGTIEPEPDILRKIAAYKESLSRLLPDGYYYDTPILTVDKTLVRKEEPKNRLGILVASALQEELNRRLPEPVDIYFTAMGLIREDLIAVDGKPTQYQFSDIFRLLSIGTGGHMLGAPVKTFYLTRKELRRLMNFLELYRHLSANFTPVYSDSLSYRIRCWGIFLQNRLAALRLHGKPYKEWPPLIHIATNAYVAMFFDKLPIMSHGLIKISPRDKNGNVLKEPLSVDTPTEPFLLAEALRRRKLP